MQTLLFRFLMCISSLSPLFLCITILYIPQKLLAIPFATATGVSLLAFVVGLYLLRRGKPQKIEVKDIKHTRRVPTSFLFQCVMFSILFNAENSSHLILFTVVLLLYEILFVSNNLVHTNILFYLIGYKAFECTDTLTGERLTVLNKAGWRSLRNDGVYINSIGCDILIVAPKKYTIL